MSEVSFQVDTKSAEERLEYAGVNVGRAKLRALQAIGRRGVSIIQEKASGKIRRGSGRLVRSVSFNVTGLDSISIGPTVPYWIWVDRGRGAVFPKRRSVLHFYIDGKEIFTRYSRPFRGHHFMEPSIIVLSRDAPGIAGQVFAEAVK